MSADRIYNFSAGPSMLPLSVLERAAAEMTNYGGTGMSVMEMSHRGKDYLKIFNAVKDKFRRALSIPDEYEILFLQGGATTQFAMVPMNLITLTGKADYAVTGNFSGKAYKEACKYGECRVAATTEGCNHTRIPSQEELSLDPGASYFHYCANNTIYGTEWKYVPDTGSVPLVCDMSSNILSKPVDVSRYALIYAGAQKNMAPAGLTVVIIRRDMAGHELPYTPLMLSYATQIKGDSMHNTPSTYNIYILGLVLDWLEELGGVSAMEKIKSKKAKLLYDVIDESSLYRGAAEPAARSDMNVTFRTRSDELDALFVAEAAERGMKTLKGHRLVGGIRASIYNAMPMEGVEKLADFMRSFEKEHG